jgi:hypothetical protein
MIERNIQVRQYHICYEMTETPFYHKHLALFRYITYMKSYEALVIDFVKASKMRLREKLRILQIEVQKNNSSNV